MFICLGTKLHLHLFRFSQILPGAAGSKGGISSPVSSSLAGSSPTLYLCVLGTFSILQLLKCYKIKRLLNNEAFLLFVFLHSTYDDFVITRQR